ELGRGITVDEQREGVNQVVVLSYGLWQRRFGGDPGVIGKMMRVSDTPHENVGVMPAGVAFPDQRVWLAGSGEKRVWTALVSHSELAKNRRSHLVKSVGRLVSGANLVAAKAELEGLGQRVNEENPGVDPGMGIGVWSLKQRMTARVQPALLVLLGA